MYRTLLILILLLPLVIANTATLKPLESYEYKGVNITLLNFNARENNALFCINNQKIILSEDRARSFSNYYIKVVDIQSVFVKINLENFCKRDCLCVSNCKNLNCVDTVAITPEEVTEEEMITEFEEEVVSEEPEESSFFLVSILLLITVAGIIILYLFRRQIQARFE